MNNMDSPALGKINHRYQIVRTLLTIAVAVLLSLVLFRLNQLATSNQKTLDELQSLGKANHQIQVNNQDSQKTIIDNQNKLDTQLRDSVKCLFALNPSTATPKEAQACFNVITSK